jgi:peptide/nickel transport system permease protein
MLAGFVGGAVVTESVFTYPGLGRLLVGAISTRDYPVIQGCILVILIGYVLVNLVVDVLYAYIDPRIDYA